MTKISRTALKAQIDADIRVNGNREITPPKHNAIETNIIDSNLNLIDGGWVVEVEAGYLTEINLTDNRSFAHKKYIDDLISSIDVSWATLTGDPEDSTTLVSYLEDNYYKLDGSFPLEGDMDADGNDIENIFYIETSGIHIGNGVKILDPLGATQYMEIVPSSANASYLLARPNSGYIASADFINGTNTSSGFSLEYRGDNFNIYDRATAINRLQVNMDGNFGINGNDAQGGQGLVFIFNAVTEPTAATSSGAHLWAFGNRLKTNTDLAFSSGKGPIIEDTDNPGTFVRIKYSTAGGFQPEAV